MSLFTGAFGGPHGYSSLPGNPECDKELLKLLPELKRISKSELNDIISKRDALVQMAAERVLVRIYQLLGKAPSHPQARTNLPHVRTSRCCLCNSVQTANILDFCHRFF